ncbi:MAG TPA: lanthionine synthetase LanC family protein [Kofleriaceae bacterium]|nr:lanthionine synthetase LanC family protein [Kofleriaceae bacterium]
MTWQPLLEGDDAARAHEAVAAIAADLAGAPPDGAGFNTGHAGRAVLGVHLARTGDGDAGDRAVDALERALDSLDATRNPWLLDGVAGVAWAAAHLADLVDIDEETFADLDRLVGRVLEVTPWRFEWEYVLGLTGLAVYALERPGAPGDALLGLAVAHLSALAERHDGGTVTWRSPTPMLLPAERHADTADGYYNLGLAHGVVGVMLLLAECAARGVAGASDLLRGAVAWLASHDSGDPAMRYPLMIARGVSHRGSRDGWCYGDQAAAAALVRAGQVLGEPSWIERGLSAAYDVARRASPIRLDPGFCHGTLGRAHMFNRLAQATGDDELAGAARLWYRRTLDHQVLGRGIGGFEFDEKTSDAASILTGSTGIALGLLAAASSVEPGWDRAFLVALPPRERAV